MTEPVDAPLGKALLRLARDTLEIHFGLRRDEHPLPDLPALTAPGASFVTLTQDGRLRGCIGSLQAWRPLADDVRDHARNAALHDPRFAPLDVTELARTRIEVSTLSPPQPLRCNDEAELLARLRPGQDGVILSAGRHCATFLPQVWEQLPEPGEFVAQLKRKAGLAADYWSAQVRIEIYRVEKWREQAL